MGMAASGLSALVDTQYEALFRYAYRLSGSAADAEDLTQETFGKAFARFSQLREPEHAKAWLFRILRNLYLHKVRDQKRHRVVPLDSVGDVMGNTEEATSEVEPEKLQAALNDLEEGFRTPLILFYFEEFSYREIAEQLDLPIGTVMSRLARAKTYLRSKLAPEESASEKAVAARKPVDKAGESTGDKGQEQNTPGHVKGRKEVSDAMP
jgi:RNA polymerase sigma-70 factor (ECF subfamily)